MIVPFIKKKTNKRKEASISDSDYDVERDALDIMPPAKKRTMGRNKIPDHVPGTPIDNVSFHYVANALKWKYVCQRRLALERDLGRDALECEQVIELIDEDCWNKMCLTLSFEF